MRTGDESHLRKVAELDDILGPIDLPNYPGLSDFDTERHSTHGGVVSEYRDYVDEAAHISERTTYRMLRELEEMGLIEEQKLTDAGRIARL